MRFLVFLATFVCLALPVRAEDAHRTLTVSGRGEVVTAPDMATVSMGVETSDITARGAMEANAAVMAKLIAAIRDKSIQARDIRTSALSLAPQWELRRNASNDEPRIIGYTAGNTVTIRIRDLASVGPILDAVIRSGANRIHSISFGLQDSSEVLDQTRALAVSDALRKASLFADAAGVKVGRVLSISESDAGMPMPRGMSLAQAEMAIAVPVEAGELSLTAQVQVVMEIE
ncbi:MAG: SIMPL domain-containing protein [Paracoccaceae bacterium]